MTRLALLALALAPSLARAQIDAVVPVLGGTYTVGSLPVGQTPGSLGGFDYDPVLDAMYVSGAGSGSGRDLRRVDGVSTATPVVTRLVELTPWTVFTTDNNFNYAGGNPITGGLVLAPDRTHAILTDGSQVLSSGTGAGLVTYPALSRRVYRFNLQQDTDGDARNELTSLVTTATMQALANTTATNPVVLRQGAYAPDGGAFYFVDSSASFSGLYRADPAGVAPPKLVFDARAIGTGVTRLNVEPTVIDSPVAGARRIVVAGTTAGGNVGGLNAIDDPTGTDAATQSTLVAAGELGAFLQRATTLAGDVTTVAAGPNGKLYFYESDADVLLARDAEGRLYKLATRAERDLALTGSTTANPIPSASVLRLQPRDVTHPTAGAVTQVLYGEFFDASVSGVYDFLPGDFDRDGDADDADVELFKPELTVRNVAADTADGRYDLNGNAVIDWRDVKTLQTFLAFPDGDADIDGDVDFADLSAIAVNYGAASGVVWTGGDFTGDDAADFADLSQIALNYGAGTMDLTAESFAADWARALPAVPEPSAFAVASLGALALVRRRR